MREAAVALLPSAGALPEGWLRGRLTAGRPRPVRGAAFRLLISRGGVVRLRAAVGLLDDPDDKLRQWAGQTVQRGDAEVGELLGRAGHLFSDPCAEAAQGGGRAAGLSPAGRTDGCAPGSRGIRGPGARWLSGSVRAPGGGF
ncbi:hypothetical protein ABT382_29415 [Streptomyces pharetrae]|uniref:hypothetical protein n=1 Tax=Streptomyces pharetrae TaxID=291370 RepID=UPI00334C0BC9